MTSTSQTFPLERVFKKWLRWKVAGLFIKEKALVQALVSKGNYQARKQSVL
jgi:hypothetical protein